MKILLNIIFIVLVSIDLTGQCDNERHSTSRNASWTSCLASPNPNAQRGESHWIMYNLRVKYPLGIVHFWNHNHPDELDFGIKTIAIDISNNGEDWTEIAQYDIPRADASGFYEGVDGPNLNGYEARYVLITAVENYGGDCYALGEVRIGISNVPDPCVNQDMAIDNTPVYDGVYEVVQNISSAGLVNETGDVRFMAGSAIELNPGFEVLAGGKFDAQIDPCN